MKPHWLGLCAALFLPACAAEEVLGEYPPSTCDLAETPGDIVGETLYLSTFWEDEKEQDALGALLEHNPFPKYEPSTKDSRVAAQLLLQDAFTDDKLPDLFQANGGSDVLRWVGSGGEGSSVCSLNRVADANGWQQAYFAPALGPVSCRGELFALPVGIHKLNVLFYNTKLFEALQQASGSEAPLVAPAELGSLPQFLAQLERVSQLAEAPGMPRFIPLAIGAKRTWPITIMAFENVLLSLSSEAYQTLWRGGLEQDEHGAKRDTLVSSLNQMVDVLRQLVGYSHLDAKVDWQDAMRQVGSGEALFTITGDWGWAQLEEAQVGNVAAVAFPGTASTFVYTPDSFAVPRNADQNGFRGRAFLQEAVASADALREFSGRKHSIPARRDFNVDKLASDELKKTYLQFTDCADGVGDCSLLLATSGLAPPPGFDGCFDDVEALLTRAVTGSIPDTFDVSLRQCDRRAWPPKTDDDAAKEMLDQLLQVALHQFEPECRPAK